MDTVMSFLNGFLGTAMGFVVDLIIAIVIWLVGFKLVDFIISVTIVKNKKFCEKVDAGVVSFLKSFLSILGKIMVIIIIAAILGIPTASMIALLGSAGVAIGLALQGGLSNIAGGVIIIAMKPFVVGDFIEVSGVSGTVKSINIFYTKIVTGDNKLVTVPNGTVAGAVVTDYSAFDTRRVDFEFSASYNADIDKVKNVLMIVANADERVLKDPAPFVAVKSHGEDAVVFTLRVWCESGNYWDVYFDTVERVKKAFDASGIEIPYRQMVVHTK